MKKLPLPRTPEERAALKRLIQRSLSPSEDPAADRKVKAEAEREKRRSQRTKLAKRLRSLSTDDLLDEHDDAARILEGCQELVGLRCTGCGTKKVAEKRCKKRWCPVCCYAAASAKVARYGVAVERLQWPLFLTLTKPNEPDVAAMLRSFRDGWKKFRRTKWWKSCNVTGGIYAMEITNKGRGWHVHLHAIIDCQWLAVHVKPPQKGDTPEERKRRYTAAKHELSEVWAHHAGVDCAVTYVSRADKGSVREALKYSVTPDDLLSMDSDPLDIIRAMRGVRMTQPFGSLHGLGREFARIENEEHGGCTCGQCGASDWTLDDSALPARTPQAPAKAPVADSARKHSMSASEAKALKKRQEVMRKYKAAMAGK